jgi:hypothetical protein
LFENQFIYHSPPVGGSKLIFFVPLGVGVNEEPTTQSGGARQSQNQLVFMHDSRYSLKIIILSHQ